MSRYLHHLIIISICLISNSYLIKLSFADNSFDTLDFQQSEKLLTQNDSKSSKKPKPQWRIVNGAHAEPGLFPWQLQLQRNFRKHCGATLIKQDWAVTAAHCVSSSERMDVMIGSTHWNGGHRVTVEKAIIHPDYDRRRFLNDIALLKLSSSTNDEKHSSPSTSNLEQFLSPNSPHQTSSLYSDNKNVFDVSQLPYSSMGSSSSLYGSSAYPNFSNLPLDTSKTPSSDDTSALLQQTEGQNNIWNTEETTEDNSFFKKKKSKSDWFFDTGKQPFNLVESQIVDDKYDEMNNRIANENKKKKTVSEYFKIRARNINLESSIENKTNETDTSTDELNSINKKQSKGKERQEYRDISEFEANSIKIPEYFMQFKGTATVVGWGLVSESDRVGTDHLMAANVRILENEKCKNYKNFEDDSQICAGYSNGGVDACAGDSGGGLVTMVKDSPFLIGIVSYGLGCGRKNFPGVYTKVSHYRDWIESETGY